MSKKLKQSNDNQSHDNLIQLLSIQTPDERQKLLQNIDGILCNILDLEPNDLPWLNPNKHEEKWEKLMKNLRLIIGKIEYESMQKERTVH
ncbi:hypothetical protein [Candidatus Pelagibacter sp. RS40]|uniref:hypothetical protein n=1 Tax=Candidatus Pelagibacter sp. RS40 TaxID=1977865 RepID=UPI000A14B6BE|nr:hypothetical protein [Candidatus Pelagibacter sp. RS40]ARJ48796.1 hypothetical protein B8063_01885 [Candidatus Pelagibacter sp. RS40]